MNNDTWYTIDQVVERLLPFATRWPRNQVACALMDIVGREQDEERGPFEIDRDALLAEINRTTMTLNGYDYTAEGRMWIAACLGETQFRACWMIYGPIDPNLAGFAMEIQAKEKGPH